MGTEPRARGHHGGECDNRHGRTDSAVAPARLTGAAAGRPGGAYGP